MSRSDDPPPLREVAPPELRRLKFVTATFAIVLVTGFVGYQVLEGMAPLDALYMTVITVTTVGFAEIGQPSTAGRLLTIGLIVGGVGSASYAALTAAEFVVEGHLRHYIERRRMQRTIESLRDHVIICGFGRVGRHLATHLARDGASFVVIDDDDDRQQDIQELGYPWIGGDATEEHALEQAGLHQARVVVASVASDADNVLVTLTAKGLADHVEVVARCKAEENEAKLRRAGADQVIAPSTIGGRRIAQILTRPAVADFLEGVSGGGVDYTLEEVPVRSASDLDGATLREAAIRDRFGCTVLAVQAASGDGLDTHPDPETRLQPGDVLVVMGGEDDVTAMRDRFTG